MVELASTVSSQISAAFFGFCLCLLLFSKSKGLLCCLIDNMLMTNIHVFPSGHLVGFFFNSVENS